MCENGFLSARLMLDVQELLLSDLLSVRLIFGVRDRLMGVRFLATWTILFIFAMCLDDFGCLLLPWKSLQLSKSFLVYHDYIQDGSVHFIYHAKRLQVTSEMIF